LHDYVEHKETNYEIHHYHTIDEHFVKYCIEQRDNSDVWREMKWLPQTMLNFIMCCIFTNSFFN
jgi:hypothetical protein